MKKISASNDVWERDPERLLLVIRSGLNNDSQVRFDVRTDGKLVVKVVLFWRCICCWGDTSGVLHYFSPHVTERIADYYSLRGGGGRNNDLKNRYNRTASAGKSKNLRQKHMWVPLTTDFVTLARSPWLEPLCKLRGWVLWHGKIVADYQWKKKEEIPGSICLRVWARRWLAHSLIVKSAALNKSS